VEPTEREEGRHPIYESLVQHPVPETIRAAGLVKRVTCHNVRHSVARNLREAGYDMGPGRDCPGTKTVRTSMFDAHVLNRRGERGRNATDALADPVPEALSAEPPQTRGENLVES